MWFLFWRYLKIIGVPKTVIWGNNLKTAPIYAKWVWPQKSLQVNECQNSEVIEDKILNWGHTLTTTHMELFFYMCTLITSIDIWGCMILTSEDIIGHWRSENSNWGHTLTISPRDAISCMHTYISHTTIGCILWYVSLTSEIIGGQLRSIWGHTLSTPLRNAMYLHVYLLIY